MQDQLDSFVALIEARAQGRATNAEVEDAVARVLSNSTASITATPQSRRQQEEANQQITQTSATQAQQHLHSNTSVLRSDQGGSTRALVDANSPDTGTKIKARNTIATSPKNQSIPPTAIATVEANNKTSNVHASSTAPTTTIKSSNIIVTCSEDTSIYNTRRPLILDTNNYDNLSESDSSAEDYTASSIKPDQKVDILHRVDEQNAVEISTTIQNNETNSRDALSSNHIQLGQGSPSKDSITQGTTEGTTIRTTDPTPSAVVLPLKRKSGRPRKNLVEAPSTPATIIPLQIRNDPVEIYPEPSTSPPLQSRMDPVEKPHTLSTVLTPKRKRGRPRKNPIETPSTQQQRQQSSSGIGIDLIPSNTITTTIDWSLYQDIPMGKQAARMMITFGDGPQPNPEAVQAALLGTRKLLQVAIRDARLLRRREKHAFDQARNDISTYRRSGKNKPSDAQRGEWSNEILYRAATNNDSLASNRKCGFDIGELVKLFPEEMQVYAKWSSLISEYEEKTKNDNEDAAKKSATALKKQCSKSGDNDSGDEKDDDDGDDNTKIDNDDTVNNQSPTDINKDKCVEIDEGHSKLRALRFDKRTELMKDDWYMNFSMLRRGSFLPRRSDYDSGDANVAEWERQKLNKKGRSREGDWSHMSIIEIRFLHWIGFDPNSALPPPNVDTTHALAFLGYDFFGRIVERAVQLRYPKIRNVSGDIGDSADDYITAELPKGEQLTKSDVETVLQDADLKGVPISTGKDQASLYFGPGFEDRLEMEFDEMVAHCNNIVNDSLKSRVDTPTNSADAGLEEGEKEFRRLEDLLFANLAAVPPTVDSLEKLFADNNGIVEEKEGKIPNE